MYWFFIANFRYLKICKELLKNMLNDIHTKQYFKIIHILSPLEHNNISGDNFQVKISSSN